MLNKKIAEMINKQIKREFFSGYLYLQFANWYTYKGLSGFGNWYTIQAQEERDHAMKMMAYMQENGEYVDLEEIEKPVIDLKEPIDGLKKALEHEQFITASINDIYAEAFEQKDFRTMQFLDWYIAEQGEEEANADDLVTKMEMFGVDARGVYMLDKEAAARVYNPPVVE